MKKISIFVVFVLLALVVSPAVIGAGKTAPKPAADRIVPMASDFTLKDLNGNEVTLNSFMGKKVLLVFGATWCPYCVMEIPDLNAFYARHKDKDVKLLNIDVREGPDKVAKFAQKYNIKYTVLLDLDAKVADKYQVYGLPTIVLIDENGVIKYKGQTPRDGFEALLK